MRNPQKKWWIGLNFASMLFFVIVASFLVVYRDVYFIFIIFALVILFAVSSTKLYFKSHAWNFIHRSQDGYDERELQLVNGALKTAYKIFSITVLSFFTLIGLAMVFNYTRAIITEHTSIVFILIANLIWFAHLLPAAIVVLREEHIDFETE